MDIESWKAQLRKGAAELAVLAVIERGESYGLEILDAVRGEGGLEISEGTIYPLLNRLQKENKIASHWVQDEGASHPRKYYALTPEGTRFLREIKHAWEVFQRDVVTILAGGNAHAA